MECIQFGTLDSASDFPVGLIDGPGTEWGGFVLVMGRLRENEEATTPEFRACFLPQKMIFRLGGPNYLILLASIELQAVGEFHLIQ